MRTRAKFLFILPLLLAPVLMSAQKTWPVRLGLKVAPCLSWINSATEDYATDGSRLGISAGLIADFYFTEHYALSSGCNFMFPSGRLSYRGVEEINDVPLTGDISRKYNFIYLEIPLMVKMKTKEFGKFSFYGQLGLGTGFRLKTTAKDKFDSDLGTHHTKEMVVTSSTTLIREAVLIGGGCEYRIDKATSLLLGVNYSNTLHDVLTGTSVYYPDREEKGMLNFIELSIGVLF